MRTGDTGVFYPDPARSWIGVAPVRFIATLLLVLLVYGFSFYFVDFDLGRLWSGLPKLAHWAAKAWPPDTSELGVLIERAIETVAMAVVGTTIGVVIAAPCCILAAQNITPSRLLYTPMRWFLNTLRGIDSFIFALLFVAAVGLGPFAGVLGIGLHSAGTIAKLWSEAIEAVEPGARCDRIIGQVIRGPDDLGGLRRDGAALDHRRTVSIEVGREIGLSIGHCDLVGRVGGALVILEVGLWVEPP